MQDFFQSKNKNSSELMASLQTACEGLIYMSETDAAVVPFTGSPTEGVTQQIILQQTGRPADAPVEETTFAAFFARLTAIQGWHGEAEKEMAKRFAELQMLLEGSLSQPKVFRIGQIQIDIFAVGIDKDGCLTGVSTKAVET